MFAPSSTKSVKLNQKQKLI